MQPPDKYPEAVALYAATQLSIKEICVQLHVPYRTFCSYLSKNHRDIVLKRHGLDGLKNVKLRGRKGQTTAAHLKYRTAVAAADSIDYIEFNVSQIARIFGLDATCLANQIRRHYPEIMPRREAERRRLGLNDNIHRGVRPWCEKDYAGAVELLRNSDMTVREAADACGVSFKGLKSHILFYHRDLEEHREKKRVKAVRTRVRGARNGSWGIHEPTEATREKYAGAVEMYRTTSIPVREIAERFGLDFGAFRYHLKNWNEELMVERRGFEKGTALSDTKQYRKAAAEKYAAAIRSLKESGKSVLSVASEFGLHPEVFRSYLREHEPELIARTGMVTLKGGKRVGVRSSEKYVEAIRLFETTTESLKSIAERLGLVYVSLGNYIRRNCPESIEKHRALGHSTCLL